MPWCPFCIYFHGVGMSYRKSAAHCSDISDITCLESEVPKAIFQCEQDLQSQVSE